MFDPEQILDRIRANATGGSALHATMGAPAVPIGADTSGRNAGIISTQHLAALESETARLHADLDMACMRVDVLEECVGRLQEDKAVLARALEAALERIAQLEQSTEILAAQTEGLLARGATTAGNGRRTVSGVPTLSISIADLAE